MFCTVIAIKYYIHIWGFNILLTERHNSAYSNGLYRTVASVEFSKSATFLCDVTKVSSSLICACGVTLSLQSDNQSLCSGTLAVLVGQHSCCFILKLLQRIKLLSVRKQILPFGTEKLKSAPISEVLINYHNRLFGFRKNNFNTPIFIRAVYIENITKI